jgi:hypothetical protein
MTAQLSDLVSEMSFDSQHKISNKCADSLDSKSMNYSQFNELFSPAASEFRRSSADDKLELQSNCLNIVQQYMKSNNKNRINLHHVSEASIACRCGLTELLSNRLPPEHMLKSLQLTDAMFQLYGSTWATVPQPHTWSNSTSTNKQHQHSSHPQHSNCESRFLTLLLNQISIELSVSLIELSESNSKHTSNSVLHQIAHTCLTLMHRMMTYLLSEDDEENQLKQHNQSSTNFAMSDDSNSDLSSVSNSAARWSALPASILLLFQQRFGDLMQSMFAFCEHLYEDVNNRPTPAQSQLALQCVQLIGRYGSEESESIAPQLLRYLPFLLRVEANKSFQTSNESSTNQHYQSNENSSYYNCAIDHAPFDCLMPLLPLLSDLCMDESTCDAVCQICCEGGIESRLMQINSHLISYLINKHATHNQHIVKSNSQLASNNSGMNSASVWIDLVLCCQVLSPVLQSRSPIDAKIILQLPQHSESLVGLVEMLESMHESQSPCSCLPSMSEIYTVQLGIVSYCEVLLLVLQQSFTALSGPKSHNYHASINAILRMSLRLCTFSGNLGESMRENTGQLLMRVQKLATKQSAAYAHVIS